MGVKLVEIFFFFFGAMANTKYKWSKKIRQLGSFYSSFEFYSAKQTQPKSDGLRDSDPAVSRLKVRPCAS